MKRKSFLVKTLATVLLIAMIMPLTHASLSTFSISGTADDKANSNKFSLKYYNSTSKKSFSLSNYKFNLQYKGLMNFSGNGSSFSGLKFTEGNTNYVIPFKYSVKVSKFKTPVPGF